MWILSLFVVALATTTATARSNGTYVVIAPSQVRPSMDFTISINILQAAADVDVNASIYSGYNSNEKLYATSRGVFKTGEPRELTIKTPGDLAPTLYTLRVEGTGGLTFSESVTLGSSSKQLSLFVQTDKPIYKPGDAVNFRVFGAYSDLRTYTGAVDISIFDESSNKLKQWLNVTPTNGVITQKFQLSGQTNLGDWKISVQAGTTHSEKVFTVAEYVLPKFEVDVLLPSYVLTSETDITVTVKGRYTYGKPITGTADVALGLLYSYHNDDYSRTLPAVKLTNISLSGETKVTIPLKSVKAITNYLNGHSLVVSADVTEDQTGRVMSTNTSVKMFDHAVKLEFPGSNPETFKPGLQYTAMLKVTQPDGLPANPGSEKINVTTSVTVELPPPTGAPTTTKYPFWYGDPTPTKTISLPDLSISVPSNGMVALPISVPQNARDVTLRAKLGGMSASLNLGKSHSPSSSYVQLSLLTASKIKAGGSIDLSLESTVDFKQLTYQVLSRGRIVKSGGLDLTAPAKSHKFSLVTEPSMAPNARIVVYYVTDDGEIVTDSISFNVDGAFLNKVSVQATSASVLPGSDVEVSVTADPDSTAHLLAVDQSVLLLKTGNDVTADDVMAELQEYDTIKTSTSSGGHFGGFPGGCMNCRKKRSIWWGWPVFYGGTDAKHIFENSGVKVLTDCLVYQWVDPFPQPRYELFAFAARGAAMPMPMMRTREKQAPSKKTEKLLEPQRVRSDFSETWAWTGVMLGANGTATVKDKIPDTITSWVLSAFATNHVTGLGVAPTQAKMTVFKPFFVSLNLPYSVTRGESVALQAIVFNYLQQDATVRVTLSKSSDFFNLYINGEGIESMKQEEVYQDIMVAAGQSKSVFFPIIPSELGRINLDVKAQTSVAADAVRRQLLVEAEGIPKEYNVPVLVDLTDGSSTSFTKTVDLTLPPITVQGSELVRVSVVGDLMGPSIAGLDSLLHMPTGCGEQTMLGLAPDVYVTNYLKAVNQLTADIESKALEYMESGYQRELTYQHKDGSFSAFGERDDSGSMWLTAFVSRVFHQAKSHMFVDEAIIKKAINWMVRQQAPNGSFPEPGRVIHKDMQGAAGSGIGLTCFVYISLVENADLFTASSSQYVNARSKALSYLKEQVSQTTDMYVLAMAAYAFSLTDHAMLKPTLDRLETMATQDGTMRYWHKPTAPKPTTTARWRSPHSTKAVDTEMTSYVLLAYASQADVVSGKGIMQWVAQQRNPNGGFTSTQDTVVALNALSEFAKMTQVTNFHVNVTAQLDQNPTYNFNIDGTNSVVLQTRETKTVPSRVKIDATGKGMALVEVAVFFNVESEVEDLTFDLRVTMLEESVNHLLVETCTKWLGEEDTSAMAVQEFGIPSGFYVEPENVTRLDILKRVEVQNKKLVLYFDQIGKDYVCLTFYAERTGLVAKSMPSAVRVYDYYEPSNQVTAFYQSQVLKDSSVCSVCPECEKCV